MDWKGLYQQKLRTAAEAVKEIKPGERVYSGHAAAEPVALMQALIDNKESFQNVEIWQALNLGDAPYCSPECDGHLNVSSGFLGKGVRQALADGRADFTPMPFSMYPRSIREGFVKCDVFLTSVAPPDEDGYMSFGVSCDYERACLETCRYSVAAVNPNMPWTRGDTKVHVSEFDALVEVSDPLFERVTYDEGDPVIDKIGKNVASLIQDGDCLQLGNGGVPNAILRCLNHVKDLGIHTEVFSDNLVPLIEAGIINGSRKQIDKGKIVTTFLQGDPAFYKYVHLNDKILMKPVDYTNSPAIISQNDNVVAINATVEIDLTGQIAAESMGIRQYSGIGGQMDFLKGAAMSKNGRPIIAMPSTAKKGTVSKISAVLKQGTPITTSRNDVHYVVTEHGIACLFAMPIRKRAKALIEIAAPQFREQLEKDFYEFYKY